MVTEKSKTITGISLTPRIICRLYFPSHFYAMSGSRTVKTLPNPG